MPFKLPISVKEFLFKRYFASNTYYYRHSYRLICSLLKDKNIELVLDVGANKGQYAEGLFSSGYKGHILSFDPLLECHETLVEKSKQNPNWSIAERMALGDSEGELLLNVSANLESSSLLTVTKYHEEIAPLAATVRQEKVKVRTLDSMASDLNLAQKTLLKLDVQGYEYQVLLGADQLLKDISGIQLEMALTKSYENEKDFDFLHQYVSGLGFHPYQFFPACMEGHSNRFTHVDVLYFREYNQ